MHIHNGWHSNADIINNFLKVMAVDLGNVPFLTVALEKRDFRTFREGRRLML